VDLSPRDDVGPAAAIRQTKKRWPAVLLLAAVLAGGGIIVTKFLTNALNYYCNVDEVNVKANCNANHSLRVQGTVAKGSVEHSGQATKFTMTFNGAKMPVVYEGEPGGLFKECIPVVVDGTLKDGVFVGANLEVKHSSTYVAANKARINAADQEATECSSQP
jgi:cytochrome c-type biogenesis protein CcmE